jgi:repressor LexA
MVYGSTPKISFSELTTTQSEILKFIREKCVETGMAPTLREIQKHFGYRAIGTVQDHLKALRKKGFLESNPGTKKQQRRARGLIPTGLRGGGTKQIPIYGEIAAGPTREAEQLELGILKIAAEDAKDPCFALRVVGDSMIEAGILEGDILIVERNTAVKSGDIVAALLNGETTVKRYLKREGEIFLVPENRKMTPIPIKTEDFKVQGKVVGLQRKF